MTRANSLSSTHDCFSSFCICQNKKLFPGKMPFLLEMSHLWIAVEHVERLLFSVTFTDPVTLTHNNMEVRCWQADLQLYTENLREHQVSPGHGAWEDANSMLSWMCLSSLWVIQGSNGEDSGYMSMQVFGVSLKPQIKFLRKITLYKAERYSPFFPRVFLSWSICRLRCYSWWFWAYIQFV